MKQILACLLLSLGILLGSCHHSTRPPGAVKHGVYYWKAKTLPDNDSLSFQKLKVQKLYVKLFDVDWNKLDGAYPLAEAKDFYDYRYSHFLKKVMLVPVVFITNNTLLRTDSADILALANKISIKSQSFFNKNDTIPELQIDCDWTASTKSKYFALLKSIKQDLPETKIYATIRLYQLANPKTMGIPPVDRGMLMFYNMTDVKNIKTRNSILDIDEGRKYLKQNKNYPLQLDVALPLFSWGVVFRYGSFYVLMHNMDEAEANSLHFLHHEKDNRYKCLADTVYKKIYLRQGDEIRVEQASMAELNEAAKITSDYIKNDSLTVSFFSWDSTYIKHYGVEKLENIYHTY